MVKFEPFDRNTITNSTDAQNDLEKLRNEAESVITGLETRCETLDDMCYNASELIDDLLSQCDTLKSIAELTSTRCHDIEKRIDALEHEYKVEAKRIKCSDVICSMGFVIALYAICLTAVAY